MHVMVIILSLTTLVICHKINKCCPKDEVLQGLQCVGGTSSSPWAWLPQEFILDGRTLQPIEDVQYNDMINTYDIVHVKPNCSENETGVLRSWIEMFHLLVLDEGDIRLHTSSPWTTHDMNQTHLMSAQDDRVSDITSLRTFPMEDFCIDKIAESDEDYKVLLCPCKTVMCIRKCCYYDSIYNEELQKCEQHQNITDVWRPIFKEKPIDNYYIMHESGPDCPDHVLLRTVNDKYTKCNFFKDFYVLPNGKLKIRKSNEQYTSQQYCGEITVHEEGVYFEQNIFYCYNNDNAGNFSDGSHSLKTKKIVSGVFVLIGAFALLITVLISFYLPELRRRIHNKIALCHNSAMMVSIFLWGLSELTSKNNEAFCIFLTSGIQFSFLSSFFWLNVMCVDIYMTFSKMRSALSTVEGERKKFLYYSIYCWGTSLVISITTLCMEFQDDLAEDLRPGIICYCAFNPYSYAILIYFYGPVVFILCLNFFLFVLTTYKILNVQQETSILHKTDSARCGQVMKNRKQRLILFAKLFLLMGLTWVTEIITWAVDGGDYVWYASDILNLFRVFFIFVIFICKKQVYQSLCQKLNITSVTMSEGLSSSNSTKNGRRRKVSHDYDENDLHEEMELTNLKLEITER